MYTRPALIAWAKINYDTSSYSMKYNVVSRNLLISETMISHSFKCYDDENRLTENNKYLRLIGLHMCRLKLYIVIQLSNAISKC